MGQVINDWQAMRKYRGHLRETVKKLQEQLKRTEHAIDDVATEWKDEQFRMFKERFAEDKNMFPPLCKKIEVFEQGPLQKTEDIIRRYTNLK